MNEIEEKIHVTTDQTISELYKAFNKLNETFYNNTLPYPYIVIVETLKKQAYGWFTPNKIWQNQNQTIQMHEIALSAEYMYRGYMEVIQTLAHEMVHLYCHCNNKKDVKGKYHNTTFKLECLDRGFYFDEPPHDVHGWCSPKFTEETKEMIKEFGLKEEAFSVSRLIPQKKKAKNYVAKYTCNSCDITLRGKKGIKIVCYECDEMMEES